MLEVWLEPGFGLGALRLFDASLRASGVSPPGDESLLFRQKGPKPLPPRLAFWGGRDANPVKSGPTRGAQTRAAKCEERPSRGPAGRRRVMGCLLIGAFARLADV